MTGTGTVLARTLPALRSAVGGDTLANRSHAAGPYIPKDLLFRAFPQPNRRGAEDPLRAVAAQSIPIPIAER